MNMEVYGGKNLDLTTLSVQEPFTGPGHEIYMDCRYSRPELFLELYSTGFKSVGTVIKKTVDTPQVF